GPKMFEFNVRFGDPECEVLMLRLKSDLLPALMATRDGTLRNFDLRWSDDTALCVVMAAKGYPAKPQTGTVIGKLEAAEAIGNVAVFHAGTRHNDNGEIVAAGGRVLAVAARGKDAAAAQALA